MLFASKKKKGHPQISQIGTDSDKEISEGEFSTESTEDTEKMAKGREFASSHSPLFFLAFPFCVLLCSLWTLSLFSENLSESEKSVDRLSSLFASDKEHRP